MRHYSINLLVKNRLHLMIVSATSCYSDPLCLFLQKVKCIVSLSEAHLRETRQPLYSCTLQNPLVLLGTTSQETVFSGYKFANNLYFERSNFLLSAYYIEWINFLYRALLKLDDLSRQTGWLANTSSFALDPSC